MKTLCLITERTLRIGNETADLTVHHPPPPPKKTL